MRNWQLTKNFWLTEFDCKDGTYVPAEYHGNVQELANNLQVLRNQVGPLIVNSGYRTKSHNAKVGGAKSSRHLTAEAADIKSPYYTPVQLKTLVEKNIKAGKMKQGGVGLYSRFLHYDIRGYRARW